MFTIDRHIAYSNFASAIIVESGLLSGFGILAAYTILLGRY